MTPQAVSLKIVRRGVRMFEKVQVPILGIVEQMSGRKLLDPKAVRADMSPQQIVRVGNYALGFHWNDGYNGGIHSLKLIARSARTWRTSIRKLSR